MFFSTVIKKTKHLHLSGVEKEEWKIIELAGRELPFFVVGCLVDFFFSLLPVL